MQICGHFEEFIKEAKMQRSQSKKAGNAPPAATAAPALTNLNMPSDAQQNQAINTILAQSFQTSGLPNHWPCCICCLHWGGVAALWTTS